MNKLCIIKKQGKEKLKLDNLEIECVKSYKIESSVNGITKLSINMDVELSELIFD